MFQSVSLLKTPLYLLVSSLILAGFLFFNTESASAATTTPRLEQLTKSSLSSIPVRDNITIKQTLSCDDLSGHIESLAVSVMYWDFNGSDSYQATFNGGIGPTRWSDNIVTLTGSEDGQVQQDIVFTFNPAVDVDTDLCANGGAVNFSIHGVDGNQNETMYLFGGDGNPYPGGKASREGSTSLFSPDDLYFIMNPHAQNNSAPTFLLSDQAVNEGETLAYTAAATDPDGDTLTYTATNLPTGATFNTSTAELAWTPTYEQAGVYNIGLIATDNGDPVLSASTTLIIEVLDVNRAPVMGTISAQTTNENQNLTFTVSATDPDGDNLTYSATNTPAGSTFDPNTGVFSWTPGYSDAGNYADIEFVVMDDGTPMELDMELITITVGNVNRAPVLASPGSQEVLETETLTFILSATDPDGDQVMLSASSTPAGSTFDPNTGVFSWTPTLSDEGVYTATFIATDDGVPNESSALDVVITVGDNPTPTEQAEDLVEDVITIDIPQNVENSYLANLQKVEKFIEDGKINAAINQLTAFINKVTQDYQQGLLTQQEYDDLLVAANALVTDLQN